VGQDLPSDATRSLGGEVEVIGGDGEPRGDEGLEELSAALSEVFGIDSIPRNLRGVIVRE